MNKNKLILLNGPCGVGKTTLANRYAEDNLRTLNLDADKVWKMIGGWSDKKHLTTELRESLVNAMLETHLGSNNDVIIPNIMSVERVDRFTATAHRCGAKVVKLALMTNKEDAIERFLRRGRAQGYPTGFRPGSMIGRSGGVRKLEDQFEMFTEAVEAYPETIKIESIYGNEDETYAKFLEAIEYNISQQV